MVADDWEVEEETQLLKVRGDIQGTTEHKIKYLQKGSLCKLF